MHVGYDKITGATYAVLQTKSVKFAERESPQILYDIDDMPVLEPRDVEREPLFERWTNISKRGIYGRVSKVDAEQHRGKDCLYTVRLRYYDNGKVKSKIIWEKGDE